MEKHFGQMESMPLLGCITCGSVFLKPYAVNIHVLQYRHKKLDYNIARMRPLTVIFRPATL